MASVALFAKRQSCLIFATKLIHSA